MRTFEYRLYPTKAQRILLMGCLIKSRHIYNEMLAATKDQYAQTGKFLFNTSHFAKQAARVPRKSGTGYAVYEADIVRRV